MNTLRIICGANQSRKIVIYINEHYFTTSDLHSGDLVVVIRDFMLKRFGEVWSKSDLSLEIISIHSEI